METEDKQVRVMSPAEGIESRNKQRLRYVKYAAGIIVTLAIVTVLIIQHLPTKASRSKNLINNISHLQKTTQCKEGLKKIQPSSNALINSNQYTDSAKETGLKYLMNCSLLAGNVKQALYYADQLNNLYVQEGNTQKQQYLTGMENYIKSFSQ